MSFKYRLIIFVLISIWLLGIFIEWLIPFQKSLLLIFPFLEKSYSLVCHQDASKLIVWNDKHTLVCARCAGIYSGMFFLSTVSLFYSFKKLPKLKIFISVAALMIIDVVSTSFGIYIYSKSIAFITGLLLGSVGFLYFYFGVNEIILELNKKKK